MTNRADQDQLASSEANWSGSTLFAKTGRVDFSKRRVNNVMTGRWSAKKKKKKKEKKKTWQAVHKSQTKDKQIKQFPFPQTR